MSAFSDAILALVPSGYWRAGEASGSVLDSSGNANNGTATGSVTRAVAGGLLTDSDKAVSLPGGTGNYIEVPDANSLDFADVMSFVFLLKRTTNATTHGLISKQGTNGPRLIVVGSGTGSVLRMTRNGTKIVDSTVGITADGKSHLCVMTKSGATTKLYIDGVDVTGTVTDLTLASTTGTLLIGATSTTSQSVDGVIDEIAVFPTALTAQQVLDLWNLARGATVGQATATNTAQPITPQRRYAVGQATETDTGQAVAAKKYHAVGQASETDAAQTVSAQQPFTVGQATESDSAQSVASIKRRTLGQVTETDTAQAIGHASQHAVGKASETDTAQPIAHTTRHTLGQAVETDTAQHISASQPFALGQVTETDSAFGITRRKRVTLGQASETDEAQAVRKTFSLAIGQAVETNTAQAFSARKRAPLGQAVQTNTAQSVRVVKRHLIGFAAESDTAQALATDYPGHIRIGRALESDTASSLTVRKVVKQAEPMFSSAVLGNSEPGFAIHR